MQAIPTRYLLDNLGLPQESVSVNRWQISTAPSWTSADTRSPVATLLTPCVPTGKGSPSSGHATPASDTRLASEYAMSDTVSPGRVGHSRLPGAPGSPESARTVDPSWRITRSTLRW